MFHEMNDKTEPVKDDPEPAEATAIRPSSHHSSPRKTTKRVSLTPFGISQMKSNDAFGGSSSNLMGALAFLAPGDRKSRFVEELKSVLELSRSAGSFRSKESFVASDDGEPENFLVRIKNCIKQNELQQDEKNLLKFHVKQPRLKSRLLRAQSEVYLDLAKLTLVPLALTAEIYFKQRTDPVLYTFCVTLFAYFGFTFLSAFVSIPNHVVNLNEIERINPVALDFVQNSLVLGLVIVAGPASADSSLVIFAIINVIEDFVETIIKFINSRRHSRSQPVQVLVHCGLIKPVTEVENDRDVVTDQEISMLKIVLFTPKSASMRALMYIPRGASRLLMLQTQALYLVWLIFMIILQLIFESSYVLFDNCICRSLGFTRYASFIKHRRDMNRANMPGTEVVRRMSERKASHDGNRKGSHDANKLKPMNLGHNPFTGSSVNRNRDNPYAISALMLWLRISALIRLSSSIAVMAVVVANFAAGPYSV